MNNQVKKMKKNEFLISIDSGGTKTLAIAYDHEKKELMRVKTGFGNPVVDFNQTVYHLVESIKILRQEIPNKQCIKIVIGLAGIDSSGKKEELLQNLYEYTGRDVTIELVNDGVLAHYAILKGQDGLLVISGTGSVIIGRFDNVWGRVGGWGHLYGDGGSGYSIGNSLIKHVLHLIDSGIVESDEMLDLFDFLNVRNQVEFIEKIMTFNKKEIADLAQLVIQNRIESKIYQDILIDTGSSLGDQILLYVDNQIPNRHDKKIYIGKNGGIIENSLIIQEEIKKKLNKKNIPFEFLEKSEEINIGGWYLERGLSHG